MYRLPAFREDRVAVLCDATRAHPLGLLITAGPAGVMANSVPFTIAQRPAGDVLCAHLANANEQVPDLRTGKPVLVVFQGPQAYVTPSWYASKREHGKVVPTWNYVVVQARGTPRVIDDPEWLVQQIGELTDAHEASRPNPWAVEDAPAPFLQAQLKGIVGLEIPVERLEGKWKASQNQAEMDRAAVAAGLCDEGHAELAALVAAGPNPQARPPRRA
jgi:transcriptional regulator